MFARTPPLSLRLRLQQILLMLASLVVCSTAFAQADPPSRVGRLSDIGGSVFLAPDDSETTWQAVGINYPVTIGDNVWVSQEGRAEIDFGAGQVRLSNEANVHFSQLDDRQFSAYLASGRAILRLRSLDAGETAKLDTANVQIDILRPGNYRVETTADGLYTTVIVRDGEAELRLADRAVVVVAGQTAVINGNGAGAALSVREGYGTDGFDAWSADRDRRWDGRAVSSQYVSSYVPGVRDLDDYGVWEPSPMYGAVWYPRTVVADWVPYRDGRWAFVRPWGWTWVDSAPWGWAPFHYGRWVHTGHRWGWCPGTFVSRPVFAPALVAWYGGSAGTSWSVRFGTGPTFGWVPLAWGEAYWPHHRHSTEYWRVVNRPYAVNVSRVPSKPLPTFAYANASVSGAVTAVSGEVFTGRRPVGSNRYAVPAAALAGAAITTTPIAVRPITKPLAVDNLPRGIPAPASTFVGRGNAGRPDFRAPGAANGKPFAGSPAAINEPAPGSGKPGASSPAFGGRPTISEPTPGFGRPTVGTPPPGGRQMINQPTPGMSGPTIREPGPIANNPGHSFAPSARPSPGGRPAISEPAPTVGRPVARESAPYNPGLGSGQSYAPPPKPAGPVVREQAPTPAPYSPGLNSGQSFAPPARPAPPIIREPAPMVAPAAPMPAPAVPMAVPAPPPGRTGPGIPAADGRPQPMEPQMQMRPAPGPRSVAPTTGSLNEAAVSARLRAPRSTPYLASGAFVTAHPYQAAARSRPEVPRVVREVRREQRELRIQQRQPPQLALQQARRDTPAAAAPSARTIERPQHVPRHAKAHTERVSR